MDGTTSLDDLPTSPQTEENIQFQTTEKMSRLTVILAIFVHNGKPRLQTLVQRLQILEVHWIG